jgi:uncharacterized membrane protein YhaH (DUF805 family)
LDLIIPQQRNYVRAHPVVVWLCVGLVIVGSIGTIAPSLIGQSAASTVLPVWLRTAFYLVYTLGALGSLIGITRARARVEAAGMMLLATGFLVQFLSAAYLLHSSAIAGTFLLTLSIGCFQRSRFLGKYGYPPKVSSDPREH